MLQLAMHEKGLKPFKLTSDDMVFMSAYVFSLANGQKLNVDTAGEHAKEA
jgi:sulfur-oxidizing protein SoxA